MEKAKETTDLLDYSSEGFKLMLVIDKVSTYASINQMMVPSNGELEFDDKYFIYLLHPTMGSIYFIMQLDPATDSWINKDNDSKLSPEILKKISDSICCRKM